MTVQALQEALNDPKISQEVTEAVRSAGAAARQETSETVTRLNERVQLEVAKAASANPRP
jgi:hypothetical protein